MKEKISVLMDNETCADDADALFDKLERSQALQQDWATYHLIGDVLRQSEFVHRDLSSLVNSRLQSEPTVFSPQRRFVAKKVRTVGLSIAASCLGLGVVGWLSMQVGHESVPQLAQQGAVLAVASGVDQGRVDDYLLAHQEYSPNTEMSVPATYLRNVSYHPEEK